ncbi:MAG: tetratricopeptide repeat protein [Pirellulaceae bacterium]
MINRNVTNSLDEAIDQFEESWTPASRSSISKLLNEHGLAADHDALTELIRIDIELRYKHGLSLGLDEYFDQWNELLDRPANVAEIAFEDFRSRSAYGHEIFVSRWRDLPGVSSEPWFQRLIIDSSWSRSRSAVANHDGKADKSDAAFRIALESGGFHIIHQIATGAFSTVYLATQNELADRYVVLKVVSEDLRESRSMAMLQHTNIVPVYSTHRIHSRTVICMPYAGSVTLKDVLNRPDQDSVVAGQSLIATVQARIDETAVAFRKDESNELESVTNENANVRQSFLLAPAADEKAALKPLESLRKLNRSELTTSIFLRLAAALAHSHSRGILHGDLKPSNVLVRNDGEPALLDFNLSQSLDRNQSRMMGGTLPYMAPETYRSLLMQESQPQLESDLYGMGVMMFEFATGRLPHSTPPSMAPIDLQRAIEERKSEPDWRESDNVSPSLRGIINHCLSFNASDRYSSADDLRSDLEAEHCHRPLRFAREPRATKIKKWFRRNPSATSGGTVATLLLAFAIPLIYVGLQWRQTSQQMMVAQRSREFLADSSALLMRINADPARESHQNIEQGTRLLDSSGLFAPEGYKNLIPSQATDQQRLEILESIQRHLLQLGRLEARRLWVVSRNTPLSAADFAGLDRMIEAAEELPLPGDSRSLLFLKARRAAFAKEPDAKKIAQKAEQTAAVTESERYLEAVRLMTQHRYRQALAIFDTLDAPDILPTASLWTLKGRSLYGDEQFEEAKLSFTQSIQHAPDSSNLFVLRGRCHRKLGEPMFALEDFNKAIALDPNNTWAWSDKASTNLNSGNNEAAIRAYSEVLRQSPGDVFALIRRAEAYGNIGQTELAADDWEAVNKDGVLSFDALVARALAIDEQEPEQALVDLRRALELDPDNPMVLRNIAKVLSVNLKQYPESIEAFNQSLEIDPTNERALIDRAIQYARLKQYEPAIDSLTLAMKDPNDARTFYQAACAYALMPNKEDHQRGLTYLSNALHRGYEPKRLDTDEDLDNLRSLEGFKYVQNAYKISRRSRSRSSMPGRP